MEKEMKQIAIGPLMIHFGLAGLLLNACSNPEPIKEEPKVEVNH